MQTKVVKCELKTPQHIHIRKQVTTLTTLPAAMFQLRLVCVSILLLVRLAESSGFGKCPKYPSMPKFDMTKVM